MYIFEGERERAISRPPPQLRLDRTFAGVHTHARVSGSVESRRDVIPAGQPLVHASFLTGGRRSCMCMV